MADTRTCPRCKFVNPGSSGSCADCGAVLMGLAMDAPQAGATPKPVAASGAGRTVAAVVFLIASAGGAMFFLMEAPAPRAPPAPVFRPMAPPPPVPAAPAVLDDLQPDPLTATQLQEIKKETDEALAQGQRALLQAREAAGHAHDAARSAATIGRLMRAHVGAIRACHERALRTTPGLQGKLTVELTIAEDGTVPAARVEHATLAHAELEACILGRVRRIEFPPAPGHGETKISYPFVFAR